MKYWLYSVCSFATWVLFDESRKGLVESVSWTQRSRNAYMKEMSLSSVVKLVSITCNCCPLLVSRSSGSWGTDWIVFPSRDLSLKGLEKEESRFTAWPEFHQKRNIERRKQPERKKLSMKNSISWRESQVISTTTNKKLLTFKSRGMS